LNWSISPAYAGPGACATGAGRLDCQLGDLAPGAQAIVHIQSPTNAPPGSSAGTYTNQAFISADNLLDSKLSKRCQHYGQPSTPPSLSVTKRQTPRRWLRNANRFHHITASNSSAEPETGTGIHVVLSDILPVGPGLNWSNQSSLRRAWGLRDGCGAIGLSIGEFGAGCAGHRAYPKSDQLPAGF